MSIRVPVGWWGKRGSGRGILESGNFMDGASRRVLKLSLSLLSIQGDRKLLMMHSLHLLCSRDYIIELQLMGNKGGFTIVATLVRYAFPCELTKDHGD